MDILKQKEKLVKGKLSEKLFLFPIAQLVAHLVGIDDQTAIKVINGVVEVVSEGHWKRFTP